MRFSFFPFLIAVSLVLLAAPSATYASVIGKPPNNFGLVGYWPMNEGSGNRVNDYSGLGNLATTSGNPTWVNGRLGKALSFNGTTDQLNVSSSTSLAITSMTLSAWVYIPNSLDGNWDTILEHDHTPGNNWYGLWKSGNSGNTFHFRMSGGNFWDFNTVIVPNTWYHVVGTYDAVSGQANMYLNGVLDEQQSPGAGATTAEGGPFAIGSDDQGQFFPGTIDEVRVYNRALSASEIQALYHSGAAINKPGNNSGLIGYWPLNEGSGTVVRDYSGNTGSSTTGTLTTNLTNIPTWTNGKFGTALKLDGSTNYVKMGDINAMDGLTTITVSAWIKSTSFHANHGGEGHFVDKAKCTGETDDGPFELYKPGGTDGAQFTIHDATGGADPAVGSKEVDDGKWHFVLGKYDGTNVTVWVDGKQDGINNNPGQSMTSTPFPMEVGGYCNNNNFLYNGTIDEVRVYNRALSTAEIQTLYHSGAAAANTSSQNLTRGSTLGSANGLVGHWTFDGPNLTDKVYDSSGLGNNGYFVGGSTSSAKTIGKMGQALNFTGSTYVDTLPGGSDALGGAVDTGSITFSTWVKPAIAISSGVPSQVIFRLGDNAAANDVTLCFDGCGPAEPDTGQLLFLILNTNDVAIEIASTSRTSWAANTWYFVTGSYNDTTHISQTYVNGVADGPPLTLVRSNTGTPSAHFRIGSPAPGDGYTGLFQGVIDDPRVYNRALSAAEIKQLYLIGK